MKLLGLIVAAVLVLLFLLWVFQRRLIYLPMDHRVPPVTVGLPGAAEVRFPAADGLELNGWLLAPEKGQEWGAVVVFNGNAGHRGYRAPLAERLAAEGLAVLLFDYRGYGENEGSPSEQGLYRDAEGAFAFLTEVRGYREASLAYFGESLGTGVALALAERHPPGALVLRSPFTSLADVGRRHFPLVPVGLLLRDRYPSLERVRRIRAPLLVVAGASDSIVPEPLSRRLFEAAVSETKRYVRLQADHNDFELLAGDRLIGEMVAFLRETLPS